MLYYWQTLVNTRTSNKQVFLNKQELYIHVNTLMNKLKHETCRRPLIEMKETTNYHKNRINIMYT